ncbi:MAG: metal-sulfur cluster assembly factor [Bacteroidia bacterium]|nr:metal-sulfur cluster assembly factor [Bacteroidia bacterium]
MVKNIITNDIAKCNQALIGLYNVYDPEIGLNVIDLGLVYELNFDDNTKTVNCEMTLTTQFCPMGEAITGDTTQSLTSSFPNWTINVNLTFEPPWDYTKISPEGNEFLGR